LLIPIRNFRQGLLSAGASGPRLTLGD
jgi:hypothetical protein